MESFGEGPSTLVAPAKGRRDTGEAIKYTSEYFRFAAKGETVFAFALAWPTDGKLVIKSFAKGGESYARNGGRVELLGAGEVRFAHDAAGLSIVLPDKKPNDYGTPLEPSGGIPLK